MTRGTIHYTNHTLMPEALERWPVPLMERLLPRHLQIIYEINAHVLERVRAQPDNSDPFLTDVSMIDESYGRFVRMGHLAFLGARKVNGVSALHGELMKRDGVPAAAPLLPGPDHQHHQRRHAAPLAARAAIRAWPS